MNVIIISRRLVKLFSIPVAAFVFLAALLALMLYAPVMAEEGDVEQRSGVFPLVVGTSLNPTGTNHDVYEVDPVGGTSQSLIPSFPVGGATYDAANNRILFTSSSGSSNIDQLWELPIGGSPNNLGTIMDATAGGAQRIDGLAMSGGVLYGAYAGGTAEDGLWTIDPNTLSANLVYPYADSISGIDADPATGTIYGVNDTTGQVVSINPAGSMANVAAYPAGQVDIDGLAAGNGRLYLITDEPGSFYIYNIGTAGYETPINNPWTSADTFSGGAYIDAGGPGPEPGIVMTKTVGLDPNTCSTTSTLDIATGGGGTTVGYCYTVRNTGNITLPIHDLVDSELGIIFSFLAYDLGPGETVDTVTAGVIVSAVITQTTTNVATWTAYLDTATFTTSVSSATVTVLPPTSVDLTGFSGDDEFSVLPFMALLVVLAGIGAAVYRRRIA